MVKLSRKRRVLYFHLGTVPSEEDYAAAEAISGVVAFRRADLVSDKENPEKCDAVAGEVPKAYRHLIEGDDEEVEGEAEQVEGEQGGDPAAQTPAKAPSKRGGGGGWKPNA